MFGAKSSPTSAKLCSQTSGTGQRRRVSKSNKGITKQLLHGRFPYISRKPGRSNSSIQSTTTSSLTTWIGTEEVDKQQRCSYQSNPRGLEVFWDCFDSNAKQVEVESNTEGFSVLGLLWMVTDGSLQVCRGTSKEFEAPITQMKILRSGLLRSVFT